MPETATGHTIDIFERLYAQVRLVIPHDMQDEMSHALDHMHGGASPTLQEAEDTLIVFAKRVWPYRKAFEDIVAVEESHRAEKIFLAKLPLLLKKKYRTFVENGGSLFDIHAGRGLHFFSSDERVELCRLWIGVRQDIRAWAIQSIHSTEKRRFDARVREFADMFARIERELQTLEDMADAEQEHPHLAAEIRAQIKGFEYGLSLLGPEADYVAVCQAADHFAGRKVELRVRV